MIHVIGLLELLGRTGLIFSMVEVIYHQRHCDPDELIHKSPCRSIDLPGHSLVLVYQFSRILSQPRNTKKFENHLLQSSLKLRLNSRHDNTGYRTHIGQLEGLLGDAVVDLRDRLERDAVLLHRLLVHRDVPGRVR